jgi:hypothetical protein
MSIFDFLFMLVVLVSASTLFTAAFFAVRGRRRWAGMIMWRWGIVAGIYTAVAVIGSFLLPLRVLHIGDVQCSDDWCISVDSADRITAISESSYVVTLRLFSRARSKPQRENGLRVYLSDDRGRRYEADPDSASAPLNVLIQPQQSVFIKRAFRLPLEAHNVGLVIVHDTGFPMHRFILGRSPFQKTIVRLD